MIDVLMNIALFAVSIPNPAPANDPQIMSQASNVIALVKLVGTIGAAVATLVGAGMLSFGNRGGNHGLSAFGKGLMLSGVATLIAIPLVIPVINRFFV